MSRRTRLIPSLNFTRVVAELARSRRCSHSPEGVQQVGKKGHHRPRAAQPSLQPFRVAFPLDRLGRGD